MRLYAGAMIAVWPLGVPLLMITMFLRNRKGLAELRAEQSSYSSKLKTARLALLMSRRSGTAAGGERSSRRGSDSMRSPRTSDGPDGDLAALEKRSREAHDEAKEEILVFAIRDRRWIESRLKHYELRCAWFDLVEIGRKLLLTGFAVLLEQGSLAQLVAGCVLASAMLALTTLLQPYKHLGDDMLAISCQAAVVANLALAILLHARRAKFENELLGFTDADVAAAEAEALNADEERVAHGLIAAAVTPIVGAVVLAVVQLLPARRPGLAPRFGLRRGRPKKSPPAPTAKEESSVAARSLIRQRTANQGALRWVREAEGDVVPGALARTPSLVGDISECHRPPLACPPIERARAFKRASLAVRASSAFAGETSQKPSFTEQAVSLRT